MDAMAYADVMRRLAALERRVNAVYRTGKVAGVQLLPYRVRVDLGPDEAGAPVVTDLLPVLVPRAGEVGDWTPLTVGERVAVLAPGGEDTAAFVLPGLMSEDFDAVGREAGKVIQRFSVLGDVRVEAGRIEVERAETPAESAIELKVGISRLRLVGNGDMLLTNGASTLTLDLTDILGRSPHIGWND